MRKTEFYCLLFFTLLLFSCDKKESTKIYDTRVYGKIMDYKTKVPLAGCTITVFKGSNWSNRSELFSVESNAIGDYDIRFIGDIGSNYFLTINSPTNGSHIYDRGWNHFEKFAKKNWDFYLWI